MAYPIQQTITKLISHYPWTTTPFIVGAPMKIIAGPKLAVAVSAAGGLGFIGPGASPSDLSPTLQEAASLISSTPSLSKFAKDGGLLPIGVGFQTWAGDLGVASQILEKFKPSAVWLFAPRHGQKELGEWTARIRSVSQGTKIWIQVPSVGDAVAAAESVERPDVLVVQGADAGGHSRSKGAGIITLLPEVYDAVNGELEIARQIPLIAAGGIIEERGAAAAMVLGAAGMAMGTRFLASREATINRGYQRHVVDAGDGGQNTVRTQLYNWLRGERNWPAGWDARGLANGSWMDHEKGVDFEKNQELYAEAAKKGEDGWGERGRMATYAGTGIGLVREVKGAGEIVAEVRDGIRKVIRASN
ncbi:2-nitropropane dioxygenase precursor [Stipitochalara longipes BDJ]|nr:2-nitropropane dioxygenase precursor [Stipitochalara longipes BDJ]